MAYRVTVVGKTIEVEEAPNYNSTTTSSLHVVGVKLRQTSVPYTAWFSTNIDGQVRKASIFVGDLSASIGVSYGVLDLSYSIPISFTNIGTVDVNQTFTTFENYEGNYTRHIETEMSSDFSLEQIDDYFHVVSQLRDYGNVSRNAQTLKANWVIEVINAATLDSWTYTYSQNASVAIN